MIRLDANECRDPTREWLVTNGLGGYAGGTVAGPNTRRYHGLLMAALRPPVERVLLLAELRESVTGANGEPEPLTTPSEMHLDGLLPVFRWQIEHRILERRVWMEQGCNRTVVSYRLLAGPAATLSVQPYIAHRPADRQRSQPGAVDVERRAHGWQVSLDGMTTWLEARPRGRPVESPSWTHVEHAAERERGLDDEEELFSPGTMQLSLRPGAPVSIIAATDPLAAGWSPAASLRAARRFQRDTLDSLGAGHHPGLTRRLALAASQLRVVRAFQPDTESPPNPDPQTGEGKSSRNEGGNQGLRRTIIAGYPWFADWGRDTMIALRGVTLAAGHPDQARGILETFIGFLDRGMLPNALHDPGESTEFNTIDATLWLFQALHHYLETTGDWPFIMAQLPALEEVVRWHVNGTRFDIHMDPWDGLITATAPGYGLTWMDARDEDWVVTPRHGKPVEIAALWYNALRLMSEWTNRKGAPVTRFTMMAERAKRAAGRYWYESGGYLHDVIDGPEGNDASLRPNQLMALGLVHPLIDGERARRALDRVTEKLLTPFGLRTLSPDDPRYQHRFGGNHRRRDAAYQMGIVWPWLLGPYLDAHQRIYGDPTVIARVLAPFEAHLREAGVGSISEIFEAEPPYRPAGAIAQAWSVGELLWHARRSVRQPGE